MSKYDQLIKRYEAAQADKARLQKEIEDLEKKKRELTEAAEAAAERGDDNEYFECRHEAETVGDVLYIRKRMLAKAGAPVSEEEALEAWEERVKSCDRQIEKAFTDYVKAREALTKKFLEFMQLQDHIFADRVKLGQIAGLDVSPYRSGGDLLTKFHVKSITGKEVERDLDFCRALGLIDRMTVGRYNAMCNTKRPLAIV